MTSVNGNTDWSLHSNGLLKVILALLLDVHARLFCGADVGSLEVAYAVLKVKSH